MKERTVSTTRARGQPRLLRLAGFEDRLETAALQELA